MAATPAAAPHSARWVDPRRPGHRADAGDARREHRQHGDPVHRAVVPSLVLHTAVDRRQLRPALRRTPVAVGSARRSVRAPAATRPRAARLHRRLDRRLPLQHRHDADPDARRPGSGGGDGHATDALDFDRGVSPRGALARPRALDRGPRPRHRGGSLGGRRLGRRDRLVRRLLGARTGRRPWPSWGCRSSPNRAAKDSKNSTCPAPRSARSR